MKSSLLALAIFFFLFALASKPSLASRHEPSLLHTDGKNYHISALPGIVQDGLNIVMSSSVKCKITKMSWPELVGENGKDAVSIILKENPCLEVVLCPASGSICYSDFKWERVLVWVNDEGEVDEVPFVG